MALVGAIAGLCCWAIQSWLSDLNIWGGRLPLFEVIVTGILGGLLGGTTVGFADRWSTDRLVAKWIAAGVLLGLAAGAVGGMVTYLLQIGGVMDAYPWLGRPLEWMIAGSLIGFVIGLRWFGINRLRAVHALIGGLIGGGLGGISFSFLPSHEAYAALSYMLLGIGITLGVTLAPLLLRDGVLLFISSADPRAQNKYGSPQQEWVIQDGDRFVVGSQGSERNMTMYGRPVDIYIPDAMVAKRHAILFATSKRFFIQQHQDNVGPQGQPLATLQHNQANVTTTRELRDGDEVVVGQTLLRFTSRKQAAVPADQLARRI
jgi:hypothetical protein